MRRMLVLAAVLGTALAVGAQEPTAEVTTWSGQSFRLAQPRLEVFYSIVPADAEGASDMGTNGSTPGGPQQPEIRGSFRSLRRLLDRGPAPISAQREQNVLTLVKAGVEIQVPLARLASLTISRQPVADSPLPPYVAPGHQRYSATAVLTDGSRVDGDSFSPGTAVLRGTTAVGRVEIPLEEVASIRFER